MAIEVEIKAHVNHFEQVKAWLEDNCRYVGTNEKRDIYFRTDQKPDDYHHQFRLRYCDGKSFVTAKRKRLVQGAEVNHEIEFSIDQPEQFSEFARYLGYSDAIRKIKKAFVFKSDRILCELCRLEGLGDFLELEILLETDDSPQIEEARQELFRFLKRTGIPDTAVETRYYTQMLEEEKGQKR